MFFKSEREHNKMSPLVHNRMYNVGLKMQAKSERPGRRQNHSWTAEQYGNMEHCQKSYLLVSIMHMSVNKRTFRVNSLKDV